MSKFYGQVISDKNTTAATRCGNRSIRAAAQTWDGSVIVVARQIKDRTVFEIEVDEGSDAYGKCIFEGSLEELIAKLEG